MRRHYIYTWEADQIKLMRNRNSFLQVPTAMKLQIPLFVLFPTVAQAQWKGCSSPWPNITLGKQYALKDKCRTLAGYPKKFQDTEVTVTYTQQWSRLASKTKTAVNPILKESIQKSVRTNKPRVLQALAHEIYNCIQSLGKFGNHPDPQWVREGSANYPFQ